MPHLVARDGTVILAAALRRILELAEDRSERGRNLLFRHVSDMFLHRTLPKSDSDSAALFEVLRVLRPRVKVSLRRELAGHLYSMERPPEPLLRLLIDDVEEVSGPLVDFAVIPQSLLLEIARTGSAETRERLKRRRDLDPEVRKLLDESSPPQKPDADQPADQIPAPPEETQPVGAPLATPGPAATETYTPEHTAPLIELPHVADLKAFLDHQRRMRSRFQDTVRATAEWQWETDRDGRLTYLSEGATKAFAHPANALLGRFFPELAVAADDDAEGPGLEERLGRWTAFDDVVVKLLGNTPDSTRWRLGAVAVFELARGRFQGFRGTARAIREIAGSEPEETRDRLSTPAPEPDPVPVPARGDMSLNEMLQSLSHEIKTPLNAILGFSEMIELGTWGAVNDRYQDYVRRIRSAGYKLDGLVSDILDDARLRPDAINPRIRLTAAAQVVRHAVENVRRQAAGRAVTLHFAPEPLHVITLTDPELAEHCLTRILRCAIAESARDTTLTITIVNGEDGDIDIHVETGILEGTEDSKPETRRSLRRYRLALARNLAERLGGTVSEREETDRLVLRLFLPARHKDSQSVAQRSYSSASSTVTRTISPGDNSGPLDT